MKKKYHVCLTETFFSYFCYNCSYKKGDKCNTEECDKVVFCPETYSSYSLDRLKKKLVPSSIPDLLQVNFASWISSVWWHCRIREEPLKLEDPISTIEFLSEEKQKAICRANSHTQRGHIVLPDKKKTTISFSLWQSLLDEIDCSFPGNILRISFQKQRCPLVIDLLFPTAYDT